MAHLCFICRRRAGGRDVLVPCYYCARTVSAAVVERGADWVLARWAVTDEFAHARTLALGRPPPRDAEEASEYAQAGAGLAAGYVGLGLHGAALITAALALTWGLAAPGAHVAAGSAHAHATDVVFSEALLSAVGRQLLVEEFGWSSA